MAMSLVSFVVGKLGDLIVKEADQLGGVQKRVEWVERELKRIQCCLRDADTKRHKCDARAENWLNELRGVIYRIEDAIDTFYLEPEDNNRQRDRSVSHKIQKLYHKPEEVFILHKLATDLSGIQTVLEEISKSKDDYVIEPQQLQDHDRESDAVILPKRRAAYHDVDETEVVGLDADKNKILQFLLDSEATPRRAVITIVGAGGLGKTTLARMLYNSAKIHFKYHIMLSVSQQFSLANLLTMMVSELKGSEPHKQEVGHLITEIKIFLDSKRYMFVLDDVWGIELWEQLKHALPDDNNGSRVLMTSRSIDVAKSADSKMTPYELAFLKEEESLDLLLKKALPYQELDEECLSDRLELADKLSKKCKGLPLGLIVLGNVLSTRDRTYHDWKKVLDTMDWHEEGKECMQVLAMSYEDMPYYLKACFLYFASVPKDCEISARSLINMWVAERFIPQQEEKTMEETAEVCLEQLIQRNLVQVSSRRTNGSIKYCRVHDLLRNLAMHEARKENFFSVFPKPRGDVNHPDRVTRRASLQSKCSEFIKYASPTTRSLLWFSPESDIPKQFEFKLLRILEIVKVHKIELMGLDRLIHLKYLGIRYCTRLEFSKDCCLGRLKNLETLDLQGTYLDGEIPMGLWTIHTLRHVIIFGARCVHGPPSNANLRNLQTAKWIIVSETWQNQLPHLKNLQKLGLQNKHDKNWNAVAHLLGTLPYLVSLSLGINEGNIPMEIVYPTMIPNYQNLQTLHLCGCWSEDVTLEAGLFPPHLIKLILSGSKLRQDPMHELGKLKNLKKLKLWNNVYKGGMEMICPSGFPVLETLFIDLSGITSFTVKEGVMPKLKHLRNDNGRCTILYMPPELKHFATPQIDGAVTNPNMSQASSSL